MHGRLEIVSAERIRDELDKLLAAPRPSAGLRFVHRHRADAVRRARAGGGESQPDTDGRSHGGATRWPGRHGHAARRWRPPAGALGASLRPLGHPTADGSASCGTRNDDTRDVARLVESFAALIGRLDDDDEHLERHRVRRFARESVPCGPCSGRWVDRGPVRCGATSADRRPARPLHDGLAVLDEALARLGAHEPLDDLGPELDGADVMRILGVAPGREVGDASTLLAHCGSTRACSAGPPPLAASKSGGATPANAVRLAPRGDRSDLAGRDAGRGDGQSNAHRRTRGRTSNGLLRRGPTGWSIAAMIASIAGVVVELIVHGTDIDAWNVASNLGLCAAAGIAVVASVAAVVQPTAGLMFRVYAFACVVVGARPAHLGDAQRAGGASSCGPARPTSRSHSVPVSALIALGVRMRRFPRIRRRA